MIDSKPFKIGAAVELHRQDGTGRVVYSAVSPDPPYPFMLLDDIEGRVYPLPDDKVGWSYLKAKRIVKLPPVTAVLWAQAFLEKRAYTYIDYLMEGPFEFICLGYADDPVTIKLTLRKNDNWSVPVDIFLCCHSAFNHTWVPRTEKGEAFVRFKGKSYDKTYLDFVDERGFRRIKIHDPEPWLRAALRRRILPEVAEATVEPELHRGIEDELVGKIEEINALQSVFGTRPRAKSKPRERPDHTRISQEKWGDVHPRNQE